MPFSMNFMLAYDKSPLFLLFTVFQYIEEMEGIGFQRLCPCRGKCIQGWGKVKEKIGEKYFSTLIVGFIWELVIFGDVGVRLATFTC